MKRFALAVAALGLAFAAACSGTPKATPAPSPQATATATISSPTSSPVAAVTPAEFFLEVMAPRNESVVRSSPVEVRGQTVPDAVVTVNGSVLPVNADGTFAAMLALEEGPNAVEVVASDFQGNQASRIISVIYVP